MEATTKKKPMTVLWCPVAKIQAFLEDYACPQHPHLLIGINEQALTLELTHPSEYRITKHLIVDHDCFDSIDCKKRASASSSCASFPGSISSEVSLEKSNASIESQTSQIVVDLNALAALLVETQTQFILHTSKLPSLSRLKLPHPQIPLQEKEKESGITPTNSINSPGNPLTTLPTTLPTTLTTLTTLTTRKIGFGIESKEGGGDCDYLCLWFDTKSEPYYLLSASKTTLTKAPITRNQSELKWCLWMSSATVQAFEKTLSELNVIDDNHVTICIKSCPETAHSVFMLKTQSGLNCAQAIYVFPQAAHDIKPAIQPSALYLSHHKNHEMKEQTEQSSVGPHNDMALLQVPCWPKRLLKEFATAPYAMLKMCKTTLECTLYKINETRKCLRKTLSFKLEQL
jgi:hypothetical protein